MTLLHAYLLVVLAFSLFRVVLLGFVDCVEDEELGDFESPSVAEVLRSIGTAILWPWYSAHAVAYFVTHLVVSEGPRRPPRVGGSGA